MFLVKPLCSKFKYLVIVSFLVLVIVILTSISVGSIPPRSDLYTSNTTESIRWNSTRRKSHGSTLKKPLQVLCYILLSKKRVATAKLIRETWGSRCDKLIFFGRFTSNSVTVTYLNSTEGYAYLWGKTKAAILHLDREYSNEYDWFIKADDDTFLIMENLRQFVSTLPSNHSLWFGYKLKDAHMKAGYLSGGAGYVFSKRGLQNIASLLKQTPNNATRSSCDITGQKGYEDLELGKCCILAGIKEVVSTDDQGRERFLPLSLSSLLNNDISKYHWIWKQAWNSVGLGDKCCSSNLISMHQVTPNQMKTLYYLLYKLNINRLSTS